MTEPGIAGLKNKSLAQRIESMIAIAHPDFRDQLKKEAREAGLQLRAPLEISSWQIRISDSTLIGKMIRIS